MDQLLKGFMNNRELLQKMRIGIILFTFCMLCVQVKSQNHESKIAKLNQKNKVERLLNYSELDIDAVSRADDLRILGETFLNNHYFEKAEICYQKLLAEFDASALAEDYMNYYFCLLNLRKQDVILKSNKHKFDSNQWVSLLRSAALFPSYFLNKKSFESSVLNSNISSFNGFSVINDTIHYFPEQFAGKAILTETNELFSHRLGGAKVKVALFSNDSIMEVLGLERVFNSMSLKNIGRHVFVLQNSKDIFYSVESLKSGRQSILIISDWIIPFPFNNDDYDCSMPFFDEKSQTLYFCSNRSGGYGGLDIYSSMLKDGKWLQPMNLGDKINTPFTEVYPVVSSYGLLFSSNGRAGMGGFDNYLYSRDDQVSYNLFPYNCIGDDFGLKEIQNTSMGFENGNLVNYHSLLSDAFIQIKKEEKGLFAFLHPEKIKEAEKIMLAKEESIKKLNDDSKLETQKIKKLEIENLIRNVHIYFGRSQSTIENSNFSTLDSVSKYISSLNIRQVYVVGSTDISGSDACNNALAYQRSISVINYLKAKGAISDKVNFIPVAMGKNLCQSNQIDPKERKVHFLIAEKAPNGIGLVALKQPKGEGTSQLSSFDVSGSNLSDSDNLKYITVCKLHLVLPGETLGKISLEYNCPLEWIKQINSRENNIIVKGEYLFIPDNTELNNK